MRLAPLVLALAAAACSSGTFKVNPDPATEDTSPGDDTSGADVASDGAPPGPCDDTPGIARLCVTLKIEGAHPGYGGDTGATDAGIDGKGFVWVGVYDTNPFVASGPTPTAVTFLRTPIATADLDLSKFPITLAGTVTKGAGTYWVVAQFLDNEAARKPGPDSIAVGDFALIPGIDGATRAPAYPQVKLEMNKTTKANFTLSPYFGVKAGVSATPALRGAAAANSAIHGDGPVAFFVYDGDLKLSPVFLSADLTKCTNLALGTTTPTPRSVTFKTPVNAEHKLLATLIDYDIWGSASSGNEFPGRGGIEGSSPSGTVNIRTDVWVSDVGVVFDVPVYKPYTSTSSGTDLFTCP